MVFFSMATTVTFKFDIGDLSNGSGLSSSARMMLPSPRRRPAEHHKLSRCGRDWDRDVTTQSTMLNTGVSCVVLSQISGHF